MKRLIISLFALVAMAMGMQAEIVITWDSEFIQNIKLEYFRWDDEVDVAENNKKDGITMISNETSMGRRISFRSGCMQMQDEACFSFKSTIGKIKKIRIYYTSIDLKDGSFYEEGSIYNWIVGLNYLEWTGAGSTYIELTYFNELDYACCEIDDITLIAFVIDDGHEDEHVHNYANTWSYDANTHWHACTSVVGSCDAPKADEAAHTFGANGICTVCEMPWIDYVLWIAGINVRKIDKNELAEEIAQRSGDEAMERYFEGDMDITFDLGSQTLTLKNAIIYASEGYGIRSQFPNLKIELIGDNHIIADDGTGVQIQQYSEASTVTFFGGGSLDIKASNVGFETYADVILEDGVNITAESLSEDYGFKGWKLSTAYLFPSLTMSGIGTTLKAKGGASGSIAFLHALNLNDGIQIQQPAGASFLTDIGIVKNGARVADEWVMLASQDYIDGINNPNANLNPNEGMFNLAGQRVDSKYKGIVIKDGKKIAVK